MSAAEAILAALGAGEPITAPVALVVAHPDDETLGLGAHLRLFDALTLIHLTDGAPFDMGDARRAGFASRQAYAAARARELDLALETAGARPVRRLSYGWPDQGLVEAIAPLTDRLAHDLRGQAAVFTHPYEGGHPDHDSAALVVARACARMRADAPARLEFAGYFSRDGTAGWNAFHPDANRPETVVELDAEARARKQAALDRFASQAAVLARFPVGREAFRAAPEYDFARPCPPGEAMYDGYGWPLTHALWRERAMGTAA